MAVATTIKRWTLEELHRFPDDGNKYELVRGELFVTPPPTDAHETIGARLTRILDPYVAAHRLGYVYHPRSVLRFEGSEVEPDLMVRQRHPNPIGKDEDWDRAPVPILVVEIVSPYTRRRDHEQKKSLYLDAGVTEYWIVNGEQECIDVVRPVHEELTARDMLTWAPSRAREPLTFDVQALFRED